MVLRRLYSAVWNIAAGTAALATRPKVAENCTSLTALDETRRDAPLQRRLSTRVVAYIHCGRLGHLFAGKMVLSYPLRLGCSEASSADQTRIEYVSQQTGTSSEHTGELLRCKAAIMERD